MRLGTRIFLAYLAIFVLCFYYPIHRIVSDLQSRYLEGIEDPLVDQANVLAAIVGTEMEAGSFSADRFRNSFDRAYGRAFSASIYDLLKTEVDERVYITDGRGRVIFDSRNSQNEGADFSRWRDVRLTLQGEYGARTTHSDPKHPELATAVLYVAAPIMIDGKIAGSLTVGKPTTNVNSFLKSAKPRIIWIGVFSAATAILLSLLVSFWITRPIKRLTRYAHDIREGKRVDLPDLGSSELSEMGIAFEKMKEALEGRKYVEQYVQTLTHEIKSPLSAIRGAAELLDEGMPAERRARFLSNVRTEAGRIQDIVDRLLELSALETMKMLQKIEAVPFPALVRVVLESKEPMISKKYLNVSAGMDEEIIVKGDSFLLHQAVSNLLQNAVDFSPNHGSILLGAHVESGTMIFTVADEGPGIPEYAREKVFEKFFSLQRPSTGKKSTGLGLNFVRQVALLHNGDVELENLDGKGLRATLRLTM
ncbi:MAG: two-component system sensor histidine kinase CreC [Desulfobacteraceae bacterium]|nr:MAG: two-component system sensor histidine kinase CreC [Desulfobacteraceae bacterium]